jgi:organic hydroperoxide reductase OsmC/OhrA
MAMRSKVFTYQAELRWQGGHEATVAAGDRPELAVAPPPDFPGGQGSRWSPEHLFLASLESCTMLSFLAHCAHNDLTVEEYSAAATGSLERRPEDHRYAFTHVDVTVRARMAAGHAEPARGLTGKAERDCFITASTTARIETDWRIIE